MRDGGSRSWRIGPGFKSSGLSSAICMMSVPENSSLCWRRVRFRFRDGMALESRSMPVPDFQTFLLPLLRLTADGKEHSLRDLRRPIQTALALSDDDLTESLPGGMQSKFSNRLGWASVYLTKAGVL